MPSTVRFPRVTSPVPWRIACRRYPWLPGTGRCRTGRRFPALGGAGDDGPGLRARPLLDEDALPPSNPSPGLLSMIATCSGKTMSPYRSWCRLAWSPGPCLHHRAPEASLVAEPSAGLPALCLAQQRRRQGDAVAFQAGADRGPAAEALLGIAATGRTGLWDGLAAGSDHGSYSHLRGLALAACFSIAGSGLGGGGAGAITGGDRGGLVGEEDTVTGVAAAGDRSVPLARPDHRHPVPHKVLVVMS